MKFKLFLILAATLTLRTLPAMSDTPTPRNLYATSIYNGSGRLNIPSQTPFSNRACYFDLSSTVAASSTTGDELGYVHGVTSPIQTQLGILQSEISASQPAGNYVTALTGDVSASGPGSATATVNTVGGKTATQIAATVTNNSTDVTLGTPSGLTLIGQALSLATASSSRVGALTAADWSTFNSKQSALTLGSLSAVGTDGISVTGGSGAVVGSGTSIAQSKATSTQNGYLASSDFAAFGAKQPAGNYLTGTSGDVSSTGPGLVSATVNSIGGKTAAQVATTVSNNTTDVTLVTANGLTLTGQALSLGTASSSSTGSLTSTDWSTFNGKQPAGSYLTQLTGDATAAGPGSSALTLATVNSVPGSYGSASAVPTITVDAKGRTTTSASTPIQIAEGQVTNLPSDLASKQPSGNYLTALTSDVSASGPGSASATVNSVGGSSASSLHSAQLAVAAATPSPSPSMLVLRDGSGNFSAGTITANLTGNASGSAASFTGNLAGDVTGSQSATAISAATVTGKAITGFSSGAGTVSASDSILTAIGKIDGNVAGKQATGAYLTATTGDVTSAGPGSATATIQPGVVSNSKLATMAATTVKGNATGAVAAPSDLSRAQLTALSNTFTSALSGDVPASGGGTVNFLRADGAFAAPPASPPAGSTNQVQYNAGSGAFGGSTGLTFNPITNALTATGPVTGSNLSGTNSGDVTLGTANGLSLSSQALSLGTASSSTTGALTSTDWSTFNGKQSALTLGALTDVGTDGISITGGAGSVIGSGTSLSQAKASGTQNGYLGSADWTTFNGKQAAGSYLTGTSGDVTSAGPGAAASTVNSVGGSTAAKVHSAELLANAATPSPSPSAIVSRDGSGNFSAGTITANLTGNVTGSAASFTGNLAGDVAGTQGATAIAAATVTGKALTGYVSGAGTVAATDSLLAAIQKLNGNILLNAPLASPTFTGTVTAPSLNISGLTANTVPYLNGSNVLTSSGVTPTTLSYLDATSSIQTQLNGKQASGSYLTTLTGDVTSSGSATTVAKIQGTTVSAPTGTGAVVLASSPTLTGTVAATNLTLSGALVTTSATDSTDTGATTTLTLPTTSTVRLTNASLSNVIGITAGVSGQRVTLSNVTGASVTVADESATATAANRIKTGSGASITLSNNASISLEYDATSSRWRLVGGSGGGALVVYGTRASPTSITAAGGITATTDQRELQLIQGSGGPVTVSASPGISAGTTVGQELVLVGRSNDNTVTLATGSGVELNGPWSGGASDMLTLVWDGTAWVEQSRNN